MRNIAIFTATRAEYGLLRGVLQHLKHESRCKLHLYVSGTHLSPTHGHTIDEIIEDGFTTSSIVDIETSGGNQSDICKSMGLALQGVGRILVEHTPDILLVLGDRYETFAAAAAATVCNVPIAHVHGGECTLYAIDESFRHSITKMSLLHFTSCEEYRQRVIQLGEDPRRVWNVGALGVENVLSLPLLGEAEVREYLRLEEGRPYFLCTFHPVTLEYGQEQAQWSEVQQALETYQDHAVIVTGANADQGGRLINHMLAKWSHQQPDRVRLFDSLGVVRYLSAAKHAACIVGNSSSGIIEIPSLGVPVVDVGNRQMGRVHSGAVLHCEPSREAITACVTRALTREHRALALSTANPYRGENTSRRIAQLLCEFPLKNKLIKHFYDLRG